MKRCYVISAIYNLQLYDRLKEEMPNFRKKVVPIIGDLNVENLGLSENDKNMLMREVIQISLILPCICIIILLARKKIIVY